MRTRFTQKPRPEGLRWLRSDGKPNFSDRLRRKEGDAKIIARRPVYTVAKTTTILAGLEEMARRNIRALLVTDPSGDLLQGLVTVMDFINYLGGGELYNIILKRHGGNLYSALLREKIASIMNPNPIVAFITESLISLLDKMVSNNIGVLPIITPEGYVWGIVTEHDIVSELIEKSVGRKVSEVMSSSIITADYNSSLHSIMKLMVKYGVRRIPLVKEGRLQSMITAKDIVKFFGSHEAFLHIEKGDMSEIHNIPAKTVAATPVITISPETDVGEAATIMMKKGVSSLIVVDDNGEAIGIVTERDVLYGLATAR